MTIESLVFRSVSAEVKRNERTTPPVLTIILCTDFATTNLRHLALDETYKCLRSLLASRFNQFTNLKQLLLATNSIPKISFSLDDLFYTFPNLVDLALSGKYCSVFSYIPNREQHIHT